MKNINIIVLVAAIVAGVALSMPMVTNGVFVVGVSDLAGTANLLYVGPIVLVALAALALGEKIEKPCWWYAAIGLGSVALTLVVSDEAKQHLSMFESQMGEFAQRLQALAQTQAKAEVVSAHLAGGGQLLVFALGAAGVVGIYGALARQ